MAALKYWVWLTTLPGLTNRSKLLLLEHFPSPEDIYYAQPEDLPPVEGLSSSQAALLSDKSTDRAEDVLARCAKGDIFLLTMQDALYPDRLRNIYDPPVLLYGRGRMPLFDEEAAVSVVGTRTCTPYGISAAEELGYQLAKEGAVVVSGLAKGIDGASHRGALRAGGFTAAVLGGGVDVVYPAENRRLYEDIAANRCITYRYLDWAFRDGAAGGYEKQFRRQGKTYRISPWSLCWADERYYMIGFDSEAGLIKHYRVDKMLGIALTDEPRDGQEHFEHFDMAVYTRQVFGMFGGNEQTVTLRFENRLLGVVLDRFGEDVPIRREDADTFQVRVRVAVSPQFLSWVFSFGGGARIVSPAAVADTMREQLASVMKQYTETEGR